MYFNKKNFSHGIMFHHFHDDKIHLKTQGSISKKKLREIINYIGRKNIVDPDEFIWFVKNNKTTKPKVCLTFDDAIKCQYDIAIPVLAEYNIKAFFFIYSSIFERKPDLLEIYRYFRINHYSSLHNFIKIFLRKLNMT